MGIITNETKQIMSKNIATKESDEPKVIEPSEHPFADALLGNDPPMEKAYPGLGPALVFLAYPFAIILLITMVGVYFLSTQKDGRQSDVVAPTTQSPSDESAKIESP